MEYFIQNLLVFQCPPPVPFAPSPVHEHIGLFSFTTYWIVSIFWTRIDLNVHLIFNNYAFTDIEKVKTLLTVFCTIVMLKPDLWNAGCYIFDYIDELIYWSVPADMHIK